MPTIRYLGPGRFTDHGRDFEARPGTDHDLPDDQAAAYLDHELFGDRWERVDASDDAGSSTAPDDRDADSEDGGGGGGDGDDGEDEDDEPGGESDGKEFDDLDGVGDKIADRLRDAGYSSFDDLRNADSGSLTKVDGITESKAEKIDDQLGGPDE